MTSKKCFQSVGVVRVADFISALNQICEFDHPTTVPSVGLTETLKPSSTCVSFKLQGSN